MNLEVGKYYQIYYSAPIGDDPFLSYDGRAKYMGIAEETDEGVLYQFMIDGDRFPSLFAEEDIIEKVELI